MLQMPFRQKALARLAAFCLGTSALMCLPPHAAYAASTDWSGGTGSWFSAGNWTNGIPGGSDVATIRNGGTAQIGAGTATANTVNIANGSTVTLLNGGALNATNTYVGSSGGVLSSGTFVISSASGLGATTFNLNGTLSATTTTTTANSIIFNAGTDSTVSAATGTTLSLTGNMSFSTSASNTVYIGSATDNGTVAISSASVTAGVNAGALEIVGGTLKDISTTTPQSAFATALGNLKSVTVDTGATLEIDSNGNGRNSTDETYIKLFGGGQLIMGGGNQPRVVLGSSNFSGQILGGGYIGIGGVSLGNVPSTVILTGNNNSAIEFQIASGSVLQVGNGGTTGSLAGGVKVVGYSGVSSPGDALLKFNRSDNTTLDAFLIGSPVLEQAGNGILTVVSNNRNGAISSFYGRVVVSAGGLSISSDDNLNGNSIALKNATALYTTASGTYTSSVTVTGTSTINVAGGVTTSWLGKIADGTSAGGMQVAGGGTLILANASNSYSGGTFVKAGTLSISSDAALGASSGALILDGGALQITSPTSSGRSITLNVGGGTLAVTSGAVLTENGVISGPGTLTVSTATNAAIVLNAANTYTGNTIISSGTLQLGTPTTGGSIVGNVVNNGKLQFDRSDTNVFTGDISGSGAVWVAGQGTAILLGTNTYSGGTTIFSGSTLQIGNGGTSGLLPDLTASPFWVANDGTLIFNRSDTSTFHNIVNGSGTIFKQGAGTLIVTGTLNASNITISQGTLQFGNGPEDGSFNANIANGAALVFGYNANFISHIGNVISGAGTVSLTGGGGVIYDAAQAYTGGTTIGAGFLQLGAGGSLQSTGAVVITGGTFDLNGHTQTIGALSGTGGAIQLGSGSLTTNSSTNTNLGAAISGTGSLVKAGSGTLTLAGVNNYTGGTSVSGGTLNITGSIASSNVGIANGATLTGSGTVGSTTVASGGTLAPGNSIGTLTINGNLTLASGAIYNVEVSPTAADRTVVSGTAVINGTVVTSVASGPYAFGQRFTVLTASGGVSGAFSSLTGIPAYLKGGLSYDANNAYLTLSPNALAPLLSNASANQGKLVSAIDAAVAAGNVPGGGFTALYALSGPALNGALDQISGQVGPNTINAVGQGSLSFLTMTAQGGADNGNYAPGNAFNGADAPHRAQLGAGHTRVWGAAYGGHVGLSADAASGAASLSSNNVGLIGGVDMAWDDGLLAGVTLGAGRQNFSSGNATGNSDDIMIGLYGRKDAGPLYVTAAFGYGSHHIETLRVVTVAGTDILQGKQQAHDYGGRIEAGWRMALDDQYRLSPFFAVAVESFESPAYAESALSGASTFALSFAAHSSTLGRTELGSGLSRDYDTENGTLTGALRLAWAHQLDDLPLTQASFQNLPGASFLVTGVRPASDAALLGASVEVQNRSGLFFGFKGETQLGAGTTMLEGMGNLGWRW